MTRPDSISPPASPPATDLPHGAPGFLCPACDTPLHYEHSHAKDTSDRLLDLVDYYRCPAGCGTYEHERRTHRLRLHEQDE